MKYRKKPVVIEAERFTEETKDRCYNFVRGNCAAGFEDGRPVLNIQTIHGDVAVVRLGDWIVAESEPGHYYPVKPNIFEQTYEPVDA